MAKSFKEIGKKAEALIEQGNEAERKVQTCQSRVASANSRVAMARAQLAAARETNEEGNPKGDVQQAQAQLTMAQNQLAASQRALSAAKSDVARVNQEKQLHIQTIEQHNKTERSNLQKLQRIKGSVFSQDSAALTKGMAERLNAAEDTRVALLRSMGIEAAAEYVPVDGNDAGATPWTVGGFSSLDLSGEIQNYQGGSSSASGGNQTTGDPRLGDDGANGAVSSGATPNQSVKDNDGMTRDGTNGIASQNGLSQPNGQADYLNCLAGNLQNGGLTIAEQKAILNAMRNILLCQSQNSVYEEGPPKVLGKTPRQIWDEGSRYINNILEVYRDELRDKGVVDGPVLEAAIAGYRQQYMQLLSSDHANGTFHLYDHDVPNFKELAAQLNEKDLWHIETELRDNFGASVVQLDGFDVRVAHDMADALNDAKRDFPDLKISYFGSCQSQAASIRSDLTEYYRDYFKDCKPYWTDEQFEAAVKYNVERYVHDYLELDDIAGTFAWSLNVGNSDPTAGELGKYSGVAINLDFASNYEDFRQSKVQNIKDRFKPIGCETPRATMDHELGHEIDRLVGAAQDLQIQKWYQEMLQNNNAESVLSGYSKSTIHEFVAEGYSEYRNNPKPREYSTKIFNRLVELRNQKVGGQA